ncbi:MAG: hypothetical protein AAGI38_19700 [Bacteroidota bacterium]
MNFFFRLTIITTLSFFLFACGGSEEKSATSSSTSESSSNADQPESPEEAMKMATEEMQKVFKGDGAEVEPVNFRVLKELLPENIAGISRTSSEGQKIGMMGIKMSNAEGKYQAGDRRATVKITDGGSLSGPITQAAATWSLAEIDRESDSEIEQTFTYRDFKAYKKYNRNTQRAQISLIGYGRFIFDVSIEGIEEGEIETVLEELNLSAFESLLEE